MNKIEPLPTHPATPFPIAAREALADTQLRRNMGKATQTIRDKRAAVVGEMPDWEALREAGRAIKERTLRHLDKYLLELEASVDARRGQGPLGTRRRRGQPHRRADRPRRRRPRGGQDQVADDRRDRPERGAARAGHRGDRDRPGRADHPACRRAVLAHPRPGDSQEPLRDPRAVPPHAGRDRADRRIRATWPPRPGNTCDASSSACRSPSAARTSASPRPAPSASSNPKATAGCA